MNHYPHHVGDYLKDTAHLSLLEHGCYRRLMDVYYTREAPFSSIEEACKLIGARSAVERAAVELVLADHFQKTDDGYRQKRIDAELLAYSEKANANRENGKKGGRPKARSNPTETELEPINNPSGFNSLTQKNLNQNQEPRTKNHKPITTQDSSLCSESFALKSVTPQPASRPDAPPKTAPAWKGYSEAYHARYGVEPLRNAKVNGQLSKLCQRIPGDELEAVAGFFVRHNRALYVSAKHPVDLLLRDCEGLRTEWATGRTVTDTEARQADRTQATGNVFGNLIREAEAREAHAGE